MLQVLCRCSALLFKAVLTERQLYIDTVELSFCDDHAEAWRSAGRWMYSSHQAGCGNAFFSASNSRGLLLFWIAHRKGLTGV